MKFKKNKVLIITCYNFPCNHSVVENLFAKELSKSKDVYFIFFSLTQIRKKIIKWHKAKVILINGNQYSIGIKKKFKQLKLLKEIASWNNKIRFDSILIRDMPILFLMLLPLKIFFNFRLLYQHSAPQGSFKIAHGKKTRGFAKLFLHITGNLLNISLYLVFKFAEVIFPITDSHMVLLSKKRNIKKFVPITMAD